MTASASGEFLAGTDLEKFRVLEVSTEAVPAEANGVLTVQAIDD